MGNVSECCTNPISQQFGDFGTMSLILKFTMYQVASLHEYLRSISNQQCL